MKTWKTVTAALAVALVAGAQAPTRADDTDLYLDPIRPAGSEPMVMFSLDYRPNLGSTACKGGSCQTLIDEGWLPAQASYTFFDVLRAVLKKVLDPLEGVQIGFMMNHNNQNNCAGPQTDPKKPNHCSNGGYILMGFKTLTGTAGHANKELLHQKLASLPVPQGNLSHSYQGKELFFEFFRYLTGQGVYNGFNGWTDYGTNNTQNLDAEYPNPNQASWDATILSPDGKSYVSPLTSASECSKVYTVNLLFQVSNQEDDSDTAIKAARNAGGMGGINLSGNSNNFPTVIGYLRDADLAGGGYGSLGAIAGKQNVTSYFLIDPKYAENTKTGTYATAGGTGSPLPLDEDPDKLVATLNAVFKSILSVSTTFVAPSVPVNVFNRAETVDEVFLALFQAEEGPYWSGNLKKLKIGVNTLTGARELQDTSGANAIDIDGRIKRDALTFWTQAASLPTAGADEVAGKDGRGVARGGAGQKIPGFTAGSIALTNGGSGRRVFTEDPSEAASADRLRDANADVATATALWAKLTERWTAPAASYGAATSADQAKARNQLRWCRGVKDESLTATRELKLDVPWAMGDPLHSRPRPVNYGARGSYSAENPDIRILMGTNDGLLHMFRNTTSDGVEDGTESWAFLPQAVVHLLERLHAGTLGTPLHPVLVDGSPVTLVKDVNRDGNLVAAQGDRVLAFFGLRRGGKAYYALDISDPDNPRFLWSVKKGDPGFEELAQTWAAPQVGHVRTAAPVVDGGGNVSEPTPVVIVGGGYNGDDDGTHGSGHAAAGKDRANRATREGVAQEAGTSDDEGNALFVINALTGELIWKAVRGSGGYDGGTKAYRHPDLDDSVPAEVSAIDTNGDGLIDRVYFGDTGGVVWRADLAGAVDDGDAATPPVVVAHDPTLWTLTKLFSAGRHVAAGVANDRRFFNRPDVVLARDESGAYDGLLIGSGDREDPKGKTVENWFYLIKDRNVNLGQPPASALTDSQLLDVTSKCAQGSDSDCSLSADDLAQLHYGWKLKLAEVGEKNLAPSLTVSGKVFFSTFIPLPAEDVCGMSEGTGRLYAVGIERAEALFNWDRTNDLTEADTLERFDRLASPGIPVEAVPLGGGLVLLQGESPGENILDVGGNYAFKTYWYTHD